MCQEIGSSAFLYPYELYRLVTYHCLPVQVSDGTTTHKVITLLEPTINYSIDWLTSRQSNAVTV